MRHNQEVLELGFDPKSLREGEVTGLKKGSRAEDAGVWEGDLILNCVSMWRISDDLNDHVEPILKRPANRKAAGKIGEKFKIRYWPRSKHKSESYQYVAAESH